MSAGDGQPEIHPPAHKKDMVESSGTSQNLATAQKLFGDTDGVKLTHSGALPLTANTFGMVSLTSSDKLAPATPTERKAIQTGNVVTDVAVNFLDGGARNLANIYDQTLRSLRDPLSTVRDIGTAGKVIVSKPSVIKDMALDTVSSLSGQKGAAEFGGTLGNLTTTIGVLFVGGKNAVQRAEHKAVEKVGSIEQKIAQTSKILGSAETGAVKSADLAARLGTSNANQIGQVSTKLGTRLDGLALNRPSKLTNLADDVARLRSPAVNLADDAAKLKLPVEPIKPNAVTNLADDAAKLKLPVEPIKPNAVTNLADDAAKVKVPVEPIKPNAPTNLVDDAAKLKPKPAAETLADDAAKVKVPVEPIKPNAPTNLVDDAAKLKPKPVAETLADDAAKLKPKPAAETLVDDAAKVKTKPAAETLADDAAKLKTKPAAETLADDAAKVKPKPAAETLADDAAKVKPKPAAETLADDAAKVKPKPAAETLADDAAKVKPKPAAETLADDAAKVKTPVEPVKPKPATNLTDDAANVRTFDPKKPVKPAVEPNPNPGTFVDDLKTPKVDLVKPAVEPVVPKPRTNNPLDDAKPVQPEVNPRVTPGPRPAEPVVPIKPGENVPPLRPGEPGTFRPNTVTPADRVPGAPKDAPSIVPPAESAPIRNLTRELDKLPATVPGASDAQNKLIRFNETPNLENYKNLSDSLRTLNKNAPQIQEQVQVALESARQTIVARAVTDTTQSIERLLSAADARLGGLPSEVRKQAEGLVQQMRAASQSLVSAELASGQRLALDQLRTSTYELGQLLQQSKGAQSALENALLQVNNAQRELVAANYVLRTGDTLSGQTIDFIKSYWTNLLGGTAVALELRSLLGTTAQQMEAELKKLEQSAANDAGTAGNDKDKQAADERPQQSALFLNSKDPIGMPQSDNDSREVVRKQNLSMYGLDLDYTYFQKGPGHVVVDDARPGVQTNVKSGFRQPAIDQQDKTSLPNFDYGKTRMPASKLASSDHPYLSSSPMAFRPGVKNTGNRGGGGVSNDPANSLVSKNYAFVVGPSNASTSANARYGGPANGAEAAEKQNPDRQGGGVAKSTNTQVMTSVAQVDPKQQSAQGGTTTAGEA